jgi:hypothetical protein
MLVIRSEEDENRSRHPASAALFVQLILTSDSNRRDAQLPGYGNCNNTDVALVASVCPAMDIADMLTFRKADVKNHGEDVKIQSEGMTVASKMTVRTAAGRHRKCRLEACGMEECADCGGNHLCVAHGKWSC